MLDENPAEESTTPTPDASGGTGAEETAAPPRKRAARKTTKSAAAKKAAAEPTAAEPAAAEPAESDAAGTAETKPTVTRTVRKTTARRTTKKAAAASTEEPAEAPAAAPAAEAPADVAPAAAEKPAPRKRAARKTAAAKPAASEEPAEAPAPETPAKKAPAKRTRKKAVAAPAEELPFEAAAPADAPLDAVEETDEEIEARLALEAAAALAPSAAAPSAAPQTALLFQAPDPTKAVRRPRKTAAKKTAAPAPAAEAEPTGETPEAAPDASPAEESASPAPRKRSRRRPAAEVAEEAADASSAPAVEAKPTAETDDETTASQAQPRSNRRGRVARPAAEATDEPEDDTDTDTDTDDSDGDRDGDGDGEGGSGNRRRRRRGGRRRRKSGDDTAGGDQDGDEQDGESDASDAEATRAGDNDDQQEAGEGGTSRRRRRRRRAGDDSGGENDEPENTVTRVRRPRSAEDEITSISGSTRLEAKKQRRRDGREAGRRRAPIVSEAEFLARREAVDRVMVIRQRGDLTQIGVLEDKVLVEHYVARESQTSLIGNVYLGRVQNVLPSMEAAFVDIGKGRNAVLYAGEVNWSSLGHKDNQPRKIESVLSSGQSILVQVTKDPIGHKGARLTSQVSLAGRFLVYVPDGTTSGISRKLPDTERSRLKALLKEIVPDGAGVIVRTAAEGASEDELTRDVERLTARWKDIESKTKGSSPQMLYGEPDLTLKVVRDLFTEDFSKLVIQGDDAWETVQNYVSHVAPDLVERLERYDENDGPDIFATYRVDEQIAKGLDRKVWLPSGGSLVIDRTEAMTVVDVNTGKFTGSGGNLEETVTKNNLEAAEEIVRQLRLRDIGGIIVVDFIDMVLESNRDLVLRRLVECLGRDRTKHQVAEVTSLGLVQMTRKRIGTGLVESFSENCDHCQGRGVVIHDAPVEPRGAEDEGRRGARRSRGGKGGRGETGGDNRGDNRGSDGGSGAGRPVVVPTPKDIAAVARPENAERPPADELVPSDEPDTPEAPSSTQPAVDDPASSGGGVTTETEAPQVRTRSRRSRGRGGANRAEHVETPDVEPEGVTEPAQVVVPEPVQPAEDQPAEDQPADASAAPEPAPTPVGTSQVTTRVVRTRRAPRVVSTAPVAVKVQEQPEPTSVAEAPLATPPAPKVVTRTRGRRTATPGAAGGPGEGSPGEGGAGDESSDGAGDDTPHVPVKKKGARKR